jgi:uncharacterized protein with GYD domain
MARFIVLVDWTQQGIEDFKDTVDRYEKARGQFAEMGVMFRDIYWTLGTHDMVTVVDAPDGETLAAALLRMASLGNFRTTTLRAFSIDEMRAILEKTG